MKLNDLIVELIRAERRVGPSASVYIQFSQSYHEVITVDTHPQGFVQLTFFCNPAGGETATNQCSRKERQDAQVEYWS